MKKPKRNNSPLNPSGLRIIGDTVYYPNGEVIKFGSRESAWQAYKKAQWEP